MGFEYECRCCEAYQGALAVDDGVVGAAGATGDNVAGAVGRALATEEEMRAGRSQRKEMDGGAGASGDDAEGTVGILSLGGANLRAGQGGNERNERQKSGNLHFERML